MSEVKRLVPIQELTLFNILVFVKVYSTLNSQSVAKSLQISPSKISRALTLLRQCFGDPLFIRRQYGFIATPLAERIYPIMEQLLTQSDALNTELSQTTEQVPSINITVPALLRAGLTQYLYDHCHQQQTAINIVTRTWSRSVVEELASGDVDIALFYSTNCNPKLNSELIAENQAAYLVGKRHHDIWQITPLELSKVIAYPQVITEMTEINQKEDPIERLGRALNQEVRVEARVNSLAELASFVLETDNLSIVCGKQAVEFLRSISGIRVQKLPGEERSQLLRCSFGTKRPAFHMIQKPDHMAPSWLVEAIREYVRDAAKESD